MKTSQFILHGAEVAVYFQINTKHINTVRTQRTIFECQTCRCIT